MNYTTKYFGLTFNEIQIGQKFYSNPITINDAQIYLFAGLSGDFNPLHVDEEFAKKGIFKGRVAHGILTLSISSGFVGMLFFGTAIALLSVSMRFTAPVRPGDTIHSEVVVKDKIPKEKYNGGVVKLEVNVFNQRGEKVAEGEANILVSSRRPE
jgi:acyl dehydratase